MQTILLFGGDSDERLVSVASAQAMAVSLGGCKLWFWHELGPIFATTLPELLAHENPFNRPFQPNSSPIFSNINEALGSNEKASTFVLALHGGSGEDGSVQELLERAGLSFTGSDAKASRLAFNKVLTKDALLGSIKTAPHLVIKANEYGGLESILDDFYSAHEGFILKPVSGGSSLGCIFVKKRSEIKSAILELKDFPDRDYVAEKLIEGREITVGVIDTDDGLKALPATEIIIDRNRRFDYDGKYLGLGTKEITPADLNQEQMKEAQRISLLAHQTLGLFGYSRSDLILSRDGFYFLEINTLPGLTKSSLVPQQLAANGISMGEFLDTQIVLAQKRMGRANKK